MTRFLDGRVAVKVGDITLEHVDAVVNAANSSLMGGGGVDGAIHRAAGPELLAACKRIREESHPQGLQTGEAVMTEAFRMAAKFVIHTVGPVYGQNNGRDAELLRACYINSLRLAEENSLSSVAFSAISTGVYGYPKAEAARVSSAAVKEFLAGALSVNDVRLVFFSEQNASDFLANHAF